MIDTLDRRLLLAIQLGLPLVSRPYLHIAEQLQLSEPEIIARLACLKKQGVIKRFGVIVQHRRLGYRANAMVVWDIPDSVVDEIGRKLSQADCVNLCYQRPRRPQWPYNLYCMIHGKDRDIVFNQLQQLIHKYSLADFNYEVLFSRRCFKQRGACYNLSST